MVHVLIRHKVADYSRWKDVFDSHFNNRKRAGETGCQLFHNMDDPRDVVILLDWQSVDEARNFMTSPDLRQKMQEAGVRSIVGAVLTGVIGLSPEPVSPGLVPACPATTYGARA